MNSLRLAVLIPAVAALAGCAENYGYGPGPGGGWGWGHMMGYGYGGGFMWILLLVVIGFLVYLVIQNTKTKGGSGQSAETPLDVLKKRYARGELTKDEFDRMKRDLSE